MQTLSIDLAQKLDEEMKRLFLETLPFAIPGFNPEDLIEHVKKSSAVTNNGFEYTVYYDMSTYGTSKMLFRYSDKLKIEFGLNDDIAKNLFTAKASIG